MTTTYDDCKEHVEFLLNRGDRSIILYGSGNNGKFHMIHDLREIIKQNRYMVTSESSLFSIILQEDGYKLFGIINRLKQITEIDVLYYLIDMNHIKYL
jgi:NADH:ubiquinone oxidoreductase subunit H